MLNNRHARFETLEPKFCLSVSAAVTDGGDLLITGDADGPVEIVAVGEGLYQVTDNGVVVADASTLAEVTDDIIIRLEGESSDTIDTFTIDLAGQAVDMVFADLGGGDNSFDIFGGTARRVFYHGEDGNDSISLAATIESRASLSLGDGDNDVTLNGQLGSLAVRAGDGDDTVTLSEAAVVTGRVAVKLGDGDNTATIAGTIDGHLAISARDGADAVTVAATATLGESAKFNLGGGDNSTEFAGTIDGSVSYSGGEGNDAFTLNETASLTGNFSARLGEGDNDVTHNGVVEGDFTVVSANEEDVVSIAETAVIGGETTLGLGEQRSIFGCEGDWEFGDLILRGRHMGFFFRHLRG